MIKILLVEIRKIFKKKSIYVIWGLMLCFCLLNNILFATDYDDNGNYNLREVDDLKTEEKKLTEELNNYNPNDETEVSMYINIKTKLELVQLKKEFTPNSWQYQQLNNYLYDIIYYKNYSLYIDDNNTNNEKQSLYQEALNNLRQNNYKYFLNIKQKEIETEINTLKEKYEEETNKETLIKLKEQLDEKEFDLKILNYRITENIKEDTNYLNKALETYQENYKTITYYNKNNNLKTNQDKLNYQDAINEVKINQYILEKKQNINKQNNLNYQLRTIVEDYEIFIVILILIVSSIIITEEFKDGTIKLLLIKPYSRCKILLGKYLTTLIVISISILLLIGMEFLIGGIIFGINSLKIPVVVYDFNKSSLIEYSVFSYMLIRISAKIPFMLILITITFLLGVLSGNIIFSITIPLMLYMFNTTFIYLTTQYKLHFMKYLVNINWNLENYLFGRLSKIPFIDFNFSLMILFIYFIVLLAFTFIFFNKKDIKNI